MKFHNEPITVKNCIVYNYQDRKLLDELLEYTEMRFENDRNYQMFCANTVPVVIEDFFHDKEQEFSKLTLWERVKGWFR